MRTLAVLLFAICTVFCPTCPVRADGNDAKPVKCVLTLSPEIDCPSCEDGIKHVLVTAHGVQSADVDVLTNKVTVRYDPARINVRALIGRVAVMGYTATEGK